MFLAVVGSLFALLITAYLLRAEMGDWRTLPLPWIIWPNSLALLGASLALEWALEGANRGDGNTIRAGVMVASTAALLFLVGQLAAWRMLVDGGYFVNSGPAGSFFYLMTAAHGLHIIGGMFVLARTFERIWRGETPERLRPSIELSATYWLFMLFVWAILLVILSGWAGEFLGVLRANPVARGLTMTDPALSQPHPVMPRHRGAGTASSPIGHPTSARSRPPPGAR